VNESLVYIADIVSSFTLIFLIQEIGVGFDVCLGSGNTSSLLRNATFFRGDLVELSYVVGVVLGAAEHHHAWLGAKHDWNANKHEDDQHLRNLLLAVEKENV